jgi:hypothetical protein
MSDNKFIAYFQNTATMNIVEAVAGDAIAEGRIKSIDLHSIVYQAGGKSRRITLGENLNGEVIMPAAPRQVIWKTNNPAATQPAVNASEPR